MAQSKNKKAPSSGGVAKIALWAAVGLLVAVVAVLAFRPSGGGAKVTNLDVAGVQTAQGEGARIVDVRTAGEFEGGHMPGAENVPIDQLTAVAVNWDKAAPVVVYCATGARSAQAVSTLEGMGFTDIRHFPQGMVAWTGPVEGGAAPAGQVAAAPKLEPTDSPVMYEFFTDWWPSCKKMKPVVDGLQKEYTGKVEIKRYNVDNDPEGQKLAQQFDARYVPTFVFVNSDGTVAGTQVGEVSEEVLRKNLEDLK